MWKVEANERKRRARALPALAAGAFLLLAVLLPGASAWAQVTIDWVTVGGAGNSADTTGLGAVATEYRISQHEVTNAQYAAFLNAVAATDTNGLYSASMGAAPGGITQVGAVGSFTYAPIAGRENMPVNYVSFYDALRFANWLHNGQPTGAQDATTTEDGAYTIITEVYPGTVLTRNPGATVFLPSEDEWYKAAYYDPSTDTYFDYPA
ncbi:MAG: formylglycine-generating enzyme family protein [bacterium]|nr:formylglycine-generating enzyme family protein [bacterium]